MSEKLPRVLGAFDLISLTLGSVIGSGIFIVPAIVFTQTGGHLGPALLVWTVGGVLSLLGALTYAELAAMKPESGGIYVYIRDAFGGFLAFLYGWALFLVIGSATIATLAVAFASYLRELVPLSPLAAKVVAVAMIAVIAVINAIGTRRSANMQNWTTAIKVGAILLMSLLLIAGGSELKNTTVALPSFGTSLLMGMGAAMLGVLWAYEGWHFVTFSAGEVIDPQKNFPRGIIIGTAALIGIYLFANIAYVAALGMQRGATSERIASEAATADSRTWRRQARRGCNPHFDVQRGERDSADSHARLLRDGAGRSLLQSHGRNSPDVEDADVRNRRKLRLGRSARSEWDVRTAPHLRRFRRMGILFSRRSVDLLLSPSCAGNGAAIPCSWLPLDNVPLHLDRGRDRRQHDLAASRRERRSASAS